MQGRIRIGLLIAVALALIGCDETTGVAQSGSSAERFDPARIHYAARTTALPGCGLVIGLDPRWEFVAEEEPDGRDGRPRVEYLSRYSGPQVDAIQEHPMAAVTFTPRAEIRVYCERDDSPPDIARTVADRFAANRAERAGLLSAVTRGDVRSRTGRWETVDLRSQRGRFQFTRRRMYQRVDGRLVTVALSALERAGSDGPWDNFVPTGGIHTATLRDGTVVSARTSRFSLLKNGVLYGTRGELENRQFFDRVTGTVRRP